MAQAMRCMRWWASPSTILAAEAGAEGCKAAALYSLRHKQSANAALQCAGEQMPDLYRFIEGNYVICCSFLQKETLVLIESPWQDVSKQKIKVLLVSLLDKLHIQTDCFEPGSPLTLLR